MPEHETPPYSILVVDDEPDWAVEMQAQGEQVGTNISIDVIDQASEAWDNVFSGGSYDLIMVDLYLQGGYGVDLIQRLTKYGITAPKVLISHQGMQSLKEHNNDLFSRYQTSGAVDYIQKSEIRSQSRFESLTVSIIRMAHSIMEQANSAAVRRAEEVAARVSRIADLTRVIASYAACLKDAGSFRRLARQIDSDALQIVRFLEEGNQLSAGDVAPPEAIVRYADYVPFNQNRNAILSELAKHSRLRNDAAPSAVKSIISEVLAMSGARHADAVQTIFAGYAEELHRSGELSKAVGVLLALHEELERRKLVAPSIVTKLMAALLLREAGRDDTANILVRDCLDVARQHALGDHVRYISRKFPFAYE